MPEQDVKNPQDLKILLMFPINSLAEYKLPTQPSKQQKHYFTHGTTDEDSLKKQLLKECAHTSKLIRNMNALQQTVSQKEAETGSSLRVPKTKKKKKHKPVSRRSAKKIPSHKKLKQSSSSSSNNETTSSSSSTTSSSS